MQPILLEKREEIAELCRRHHVLRLDVFGSAVRDDFNPETSDFDFLVVWDRPEVNNTYNNYLDFKDELKALLGRSVDVITEGSVRNPYVLETIREDQRLLYAA